MSLESDLNELRHKLTETSTLENVEALAGWDQATYMPHGAAEERGEQMGALAAIIHEKRTSDELGSLLEELAPLAEQMDPDSDDASLIRVARHDFLKEKKVPIDWVTEFAQATSVGQTAWETAKATNDFELFRPHLEHILELKKAYTGFFRPFEHPYDALLDDFEPGMKTSEVIAIFNQLRPAQIALLRAIQERPAPDDHFLNGDFPQANQWNLTLEALRLIGFDFDRGRQDYSVHPFTTSLGPNDVRITTRIDPHDPLSALLSSIHEGGHALYDQGYPVSLRRTPLAEGASLGVHESQSRLWENCIGRSLPFWTFFYPRFQSAYAPQFDGISLDDFYHALNKVTPSFIRTEADEATYNLHIMLRFDLELELLEGKLAVSDLPKAWGERSREYLGITPPDDSHGVLQDVHWSGGMFGYFPTYALGNVISAQLWETAHKDIPDLDEQIRQGHLGVLVEWLRLHVHRFGRKFEPQELVRRATGSRIDPSPYLRYLQGKYGELYRL